MGTCGIFIDIETTGLDPTRHRALEIACKCMNLTTGEPLGKYHTVVKQPIEVWERSDRVSLAVNGFQWEDLASGLEESEVAEQLISLFKQLNVARGKAVFIAQNPTFDRAYFSQLVPVYRQEQLNWPYHWLDFASMYWALQVEQLRMTPPPPGQEINLSKDTIAKQYGLPPEPHPHRAMNGVEHLIQCYSRVVGWTGAPAR